MNNPAHLPRRHGFDYYFGLPHSNDLNPTLAAPWGATSRLDHEVNGFLEFIAPVNTRVLGFPPSSEASGAH